MLGERDGLPTFAKSNNRLFSKEAAKLVAVHKAKGKFQNLTNRYRGVDPHAVTAALERHVSNSPSKTNRHQRDPSTEEKEVERLEEAVDVGKGAVKDERRHSKTPFHFPRWNTSTSTLNAPPKSAAGTGILSSLLKLYELPQSVASSQATLVPIGSEGNTPPNSRQSFDNLGKLLKHTGENVVRGISKSTEVLGSEIGSKMGLETMERPLQARSGGEWMTKYAFGSVKL